MSKILVTGAGGYMGRHIVTSLLDKGADIIAVDFNIDLIDERADRRVVDIFSGDENLYEKLGKPDVCLHRPGGGDRPPGLLVRLWQPGHPGCGPDTDERPVLCGHPSI